MQTYLAAFIVALVVTVLGTPMVIRFANRWGAVAIPNARSMHKAPIPCIGGLAIYAGFMVAMLSVLGLNRLSMGIATGGSFIVAIGLIDDTIELKAKTKFVAQIIIALVPVMLGNRVDFISNPFGPGMLYVGAWGVPITVLWIVSVVNVINFIDGLDGLCAGVSSIAAVSLFVVALSRGMVPLAILCAALAGSSAGFLRYNFSPARVFMGDTGSMFLGYVLAVISIQGALKGAAAVALTIPALAMGVPIFDTAFAILRRYKRGQKIYEADKDHIHHRLVAMGLSQKRAVLVIYGISAALGGVAIVVATSGKVAADLLTVAVCGIMVAGASKLGILDTGGHCASRDKQG